MTILSRLLGRALDLPPPETHDVTVEAVEIPMPDGVTLRANHYAPRDLENRPTILIRSPYPRRGFGLISRLLSERGFHVLLVNCRGTFGSGGSFEPFRHERVDGLATVDWLADRPWFTGELATTGSSYLGFTQWAIASEIDRETDATLVAMSTQATSAEFRSFVYPGCALGLDALDWATSMADPDGPAWRFFARQFGVGVDGEDAKRHLPLLEADEVAVGEPIDFWRGWLAHETDDDWWDDCDHTADVADVSAPNHIVSGWHDVMLPQCCREYRELAAAERKPYLTIGPWGHDDGGLHAEGIRTSIRWFRAHLLDDHDSLRTDPVRLYVQGADEWRTYDAWPLTDVELSRWFFQPDGGLDRDRPAVAGTDVITYDPTDPTPNVGGAVLGTSAGQQPQGELESRSDVLTYTSSPLREPLEVIGAVSATVFHRSNRDYADCYVCLCDVEPDGTSKNVCDGFRRLEPADPPADENGHRTDGNGSRKTGNEVRRVAIDCWPTAYRFDAGHRLRVQVASGAFPRWSRNPGNGEPIGKATDLCRADHEIHVGPDRPSWFTLPVVSRRSGTA